jgi:putative tributyrin esterase
MKKKYFLIPALLLVSVLCHAAKVDTLAIPSAAMNKTYKAAIALPNSYAKGKATYPVLYLLHGAYGHFGDWLKSTSNKNAVKDLADQYNIIIVMPEGENFGFYINSPVNKGSQFETYIIDEVIPAIDRTYRTIASKNGRAITGLSMGGHGALYLSTRHAELFCAAGSMSGAVDLGGLYDPKSADRKKMMEPVFGNADVPREIYQSFAVLNMIEKIRANKLPLFIDCGVDDFLIDANRELHRRLVYEKIPHDYSERPGAHTWDYWENALPYHMLFFNTIFKSNGAVAKFK